MTRTTTATDSKCYLGAPCGRTDCDFCDQGKRDAVTDSARKMLLPRRPHRVLLAASFLFPFVSRGVLKRLGRTRITKRLKDVIAGAGLGRTRVLASFKLHYGGLGYCLEFTALIDLPATADIASVKKKLADEVLSWTLHMNYSFKVVRGARLLDASLKRIFSWDRHTVAEWLGKIPPRYRSEPAKYLKTIPSMRRIWANRVRRSRDGMFHATAR